MKQHGQFLFSAIALCFFLASCNKINNLTTTTCSDEDGISVAKSIVVDAASAALALEKNSDQVKIFDPASIRATFAQIKISFENIRTSKTDPNSTKVFCSATYTATIPTDLYKKISDGLVAVEHKGGLESLAEKYNFTAASNTFTHEIEYSLQPTDDRTSIFAQLTDADSPTEFLQEAVAAALIKPILDAKKSDHQDKVMDSAAVTNSLDQETASEQEAKDSNHSGSAVISVDLGSTVDQDGAVEVKKEVFESYDTIHASVVTEGSPRQLSVVWKYNGNQTVYTESKEIPEGRYITDFSVSKPDGWPQGSYSVDILLNGDHAASSIFIIP